MAPPEECPLAGLVRLHHVRALVELCIGLSDRAVEHHRHRQQRVALAGVVFDGLWHERPRQHLAENLGVHGPADDRKMLEARTDRYERSHAVAAGAIAARRRVAIRSAAARSVSDAE